MAHVNDHEQVARLLFYPQMVYADGTPKPNIFPTDELTALNGKNGVSVDRCELLGDPARLLRQKADEMANPAAERIPWGYCIGKAEQIRLIAIADNESQQAFKICPDAVASARTPRPWDLAHAIVVKFDNSCTRAQMRGVRDKLMQAFSCKTKFR
ncbi:MAG: hypothetical protein OXD29_04970 [Roseovarius sp.]|nr:hypothetical protein [Roseovarius sp.]